MGIIPMRLKVTWGYLLHSTEWLLSAFAGDLRVAVPSRERHGPEQASDRTGTPNRVRKLKVRVE